MPELTTRKVKLEDVEDLAKRLRKSDLNELRLTSAEPVIEILDRSVCVSDPDLLGAAEIDGKLVALYGTNFLRPNLGGIWLLGSDELTANPRAFLKESLRFLKVSHERYQYLTNFLDPMNTVSRKWVEWMGFVAVGNHGPYIQYVSGRT